MTNTPPSGRGARPHSFLAATLLAPLLVASSAAAAQFNFENPGDGSFRSGVAVISGWACNAETVTIELAGTEGSETVEANYGTPRADTAVPAHCGVGDEDNGFGALTNLNRLGSGPATATLKIDGVVVATNDFTVTKPTDVNFNRDISGAFTLPGFPGAGEAVDAIWTTSTQGFSMAPAGSSPATSSASTSCPTAFGTDCNLENPGPFQFASGIFVFSGWICDVADSVELIVRGVDGMESIAPAYGTERGDTAGTCGDTNNGFGALSNVNRLGQGPATVELWIDGILAVTNSFWVTKPSDENFNRDASGEYTIPGFPDASKDTVILWQSGDQNFSIKEVVATAGTPTPTPEPGSIPTPGVTPTASPVPTATPPGSPTPTPGGGPTPTPGGGPVCGNGIVEGDEQCDGADLGEYETCFDAFEGYNPDAEEEECLAGSSISCAPDCTIDGSQCSCTCEEDFDCILPEMASGVLVDCGPQYCTQEFCDPEDIADCECTIGNPEGDLDGACLGSDTESGALGFCIVQPFDPGENDADLIDLCTGFDGGDPEFPRCDYCDF